MAQNPIQHRITQRTMVMQEEISPTPNVALDSPFLPSRGTPNQPKTDRRTRSPTRPTSPSPTEPRTDRRSRSPVRPTSPGGEELIQDVVNILADFQARCEEVMASLTLPKPEGEMQADTPAVSTVPANTGVVKPTLEDMLNLIQFGMTQFIEERSRHINNLQNVVNRNLNCFVDAQNKLAEFELAIENGTQFIPSFIQMFSNNATSFTGIYEDCTNSSSPFPNLQAIDHPSPEVTQKAFSDLVWQVVVMCHQAERTLRLQELLYSSLDEATEYIKERLDCTLNNMRYFSDLTEETNKDNQGLLRTFGEKKLMVEKFLSEWKKGGEELNQSDTPHQSPQTHTSITNTQPASASGPRPVQLMKDEPMTPPSQTSSPQTPVGQREARVKALQGKTQMVEEIVKRYNELHGTILHEIKNIRDQNEVLEQSVVAMQNIPENPENAQKKEEVNDKDVIKQ